MSKCDSSLFYGMKLSNKFPNTRQFGAKYALYVLSFINLLNFADRYVPSAVKQLIIDDLHLTDFQSSLPNTGMIIVYMLFAIIFGLLNDKEIYDRRVILWLAIIFWSIFTALAGLATNLTSLILLRSLVGVGEAAYGTIAPPMIGDYYPFQERNTAYGIYFLAIPIGGACGYAIGAVIGSAFSWRIAFIVCGGPGIIAAVLALTINDPVRGINDIDIKNEKESNNNNNDNNYNINHTVENPMITSNDTSNNSSSSSIPMKDPIANNENDNSNSKILSTYDQFKIVLNEMIEILQNKHFMLATFGLIGSSFALGGLAEWLATYLLRYDNVSIDTAGLVVGAATIIGGLVGTVVGSKVTDYVYTFIPGAYFLIPALFQIPGGICVFLVVNISGYFGLVCVILFIGEICIWAYLAPISALSISSIPARLRARSCGVQILLQHILGDIISPPIIGAISDSTGSLRTGLQLTWIAVFFSGLFWGLGYYFLIPIAKSNDKDSDNYIKEPSYLDLLYSEDTLILVNNEIVRRKSTTKSTSSSRSNSFSNGSENILTNSMQDAMTLPLLEQGNE